MISVFIIDDHYMVVEGIRTLLHNESEIEFVGSAGSIESAEAFLKLKQPDVVLLDINLPDGNGIDYCKTLKAIYPQLNILGLSTFNQASYIKDMIDNGANGYILKNATQKELTEAIKLAAIGKSYMAFEVAKTLHNYELQEQSKIVISKREKEVLELIRDGNTNGAIAAKLFVSTHTVDTYRKSLLAKLEAKNTAELIKIALVKNLITLN